MTLKRFIFVFVVALLVGSCHPESRFWSNTQNHIPYHLYTWGDGTIHPEKEDYVIAHLILQSTDSQLIYDNFTFKKDFFKTFKINDTLDGGLGEVFRQLYAGDSAVFLLPRAASGLDSVISIPQNFDTCKTFLASVNLQQLLSPAQYEEIIRKRWEAAFNSATDKEPMANYLKENGIGKKHERNGIYLKILKSGKGHALKTGQRVAIHYTAMFADGKRFDDTRPSGMPLEFTFGDPDQVIEGIYIGLSYLNKGSKAIFVIPPPLAFGEDGSSTGIVPPNKTVIYEIEVIDVQ